MVTIKIQKFIAALTAALFILSFGFSVSAANVEVRAITQEEWFSMTVSERDSYLNAAIEKNGGEVPTFSGSGRLGKFLSYKYYWDLFNGNPNAKVSLQMMGLVDFNLKLGDTSHEGGGFGGHRGDIDRSFEDFMLEQPYSGDNDYPAFEFTDGRYITWEPLLVSGYTDPNKNIGGVTHKAERYGIRFYLHDKSGKIIDMADRNSSTQICLSCKCVLCNGGDEPFTDFRFTEDGFYCYTYYGWSWKEDHVTHNTVAEPIGSSTGYFRLPWTNNDTTGTSVDAPVTIPVILYNTEDNTTVNTYRDGDNITYEGNTYSYDNSSHSVNIDGRTYNIYYNYDGIDSGDNGSSYLQDFYNYLTNTYITNNYGTTINFDDSNILNALYSIYNKLHAIFSRIQSGFNSVVQRLDTIISKIGGGIGLTKEFLLDVFLGDIKSFDEQKQIDEVSALVNDKFAFVTSLSDFINKALEIYKGSSESPVITVPFKGKQYTVDFNVFSASDIDKMRYLLAGFVYLTFAFNTYRRIPSYINNGGDC